MRTTALLAKLETVLSKRYAAIRLKPAAPKAKVPAKLAPLYRWRGGSETELFGGYLWLSPEHALGAQKMMDALLAKEPGWKQTGWWRRKWFPFLDDQAGNLYCLDGEGAFGGKPGQIIHFDHEAGPEVAFENLDRLVATMIALAERGALLAEDPDAFELVYKKQNPGFPHKGSPKLQKLLDEMLELYNTGSYGPLLARADRALKLAPADPRLYGWRWIALEQLDRDEEALEAMERELELAKPVGPPGYRTYRAKADCLARLERFDEAAATVKKWLPLIGGDEVDRVSAYRILGDVLRWSGRPAEAKKAYEMGLPAVRKLSWTEYTYWTQYIRVLDGRERKRALEEARRATEKLLKRVSGEAEPLYYLAWFCLELGDEKRALEHLATAIELNPDYREEVAEDGDFKRLRKNARFQALVAPRGSRG